MGESYTALIYVDKGTIVFLIVVGAVIAALLFLLFKLKRKR